ncbi:SGNH/GDSL hydrolase family protein [Kocuria sp. LHG3120]|uniref:SGNH/GDSL hydrolase family protein n=1 Tax=Kocuria sp. LHG3120 TaxID=2804590 RepID=UPI003CEB7261
MHSTPRSAGTRQEKKPTPRNKKLANVAIIGAVMLLVVGLGATFVRAEQAQARSVAAAENYVAPTYTPPTDDRPVAAFLGDSFTAGTGAGSQSKRWTTLVAASQGWRELNYGSGGTNYGTDGPTSTAQSYAERLTSLTMSAPDIVIVSSAGNSMNQEQQEGITTTFESLREKLPDAQILATSPYTRSGVFPEHLEEFGEQIEEAVESVNGRYLDIDHPLGDRPGVMSDDGVHPNAEGYQLIADAVEAAL